MLAALLNLFSSDGYMPHGMCLLWEPNLLFLHIASDGLIGLSYFSMPIALIYFARRRTDLSFSWLFILFGVFILACGTTHIFSIWTLWHPDYVLDGLIKAITAAASVTTAVLLWSVLPKALVLPNLKHLATLNETLRQQISEREASEKALKETHRKLVDTSAKLEQSRAEALELSDRLALGTEAGGIGVWNYDIASSTLWRDSRMHELFDLSPTEASANYQLWLDRVHPEDRLAVEQAFQNSITLGVPYSAEFRLMPRTGHLRTIKSHGKISIGQDGKPARLAGISYDVTDLRQREKDAQRRALDRFSRVVEAAPNAMLLVSAEGIIEMANSAAETVFDCPRQDLLGTAVRNLLPSRLMATYQTLWRGSLAGTDTGSTTESQPLFGIRRDGSEFPIELSLHPIDTDEGTMVLAVVIDITERQRTTDELNNRAAELNKEIAQRRDAEEALRKRSEDFRYLFHNNPLPMWIYDQSTLAFLEVNEAAVLNYGYSRSEFASMSIRDIRPPTELHRLKENLIAETVVYQASSNWQHRRKNGEVIRVDIFSHAISFEGKAARLIIALDVTKRTEAEEHLRQAQKMDAIGQLTGGVAHDFNNLLAIIQGNLELVMGLLEPKSDLAEMASDALKAAERGAKLTQQLLAYSRQQPLEPRVLGLESVITELDTLLTRTLGEIFQIDHIVAADLWRVRIDRNQLENALLNLAVNARDAMPGGGRLLIEASNTILDENYAEQNADVRPGKYVMIAVTDSGTGMSAETISRAFEPFFTTKVMGRGTGLGLSMVYGFVKQSGGHIKIYSEQGHGTSIKLYLPQAAAEPSDGPTSAESQAHQATTGDVVLVVEDDDAVRKLAVRLLTSLGYITIEAKDGPSALTVLKSTSKIDLLFTDVVMPMGMNGPALARAAQAERPNLKVLYMSGYTKNAVLHNGELDEGVHLLTKPFHMAELARKVREALDEGV